MDRRTEQGPAREEEMNREHGRSDRGGPGREQRPAEQFPQRDNRPEPSERQPHDMPRGGSSGERREPDPNRPQPTSGERKFGERKFGERKFGERTSGERGKGSR